MKSLALLFIAGAAFAQNAAVFPGRAATNSDLKVATNNYSSILAMGVNTTATTLTVASTSGFVAPGVVTLDSEVMAVCAVASGTTFTVGSSACPNVDGRGYDGTSAVSHAANRPIQGRITAALHNQVAAETIAIEDKLHVEIPSVVDKGADPTGASDSLAAFNAAIAGSRFVTVPQGTYKLSGALVLSAGQTLAGVGTTGQSPAAGTTLNFTGPTDGIQLPPGNGTTVENLVLVTTNASAGKAISAPGSSSGNLIQNVVITNQTAVAGAQQWTYGLYAATDMESSTAVNLSCYSVPKCVSLNGTSNANTFVAPIVGGAYTTGVEINNAKNTVIQGGTIQGNASTALVNASSVRVYGTWLEQVNNSAPMITGTLGTTDEVLIDGSPYAGGNAADGFSFSGQGNVVLRGLTGFLSTSGCVVRHTGAATPTLGRLTVSDSVIWNAGSGHGICGGSSGQDIQQVTVNDNLIDVGGYGLTVTGTALSNYTFNGNYFLQSNYGILRNPGPPLLYSQNHFYSGNGPSTAYVCNLCSGTESGPGNTYYTTNTPLPEYVPILQTSAFYQPSLSTLASASTIAPTFLITAVTGTTTIQTITPPGVIASNAGCLYLLAGGAWSTGTMGNIINAVTAATGEVHEACYDGNANRWYVSK